MSMCRCAPPDRAARSRGRRRRAASRWPRSGASGRSSGVSAEIFTHTLARGSGPTPSASSVSRAGQPGWRVDEPLDRLQAARGVAVGLGLGDGGLAEQVDGAGDAALPQLAQRPQGSCGRLADDEAMGEVADPAGRRRAQGGAAGPRARTSASPPRSAAGVSGTSSRKPIRWRARSSSERHAGTTSTKRNSAARSSRSLEAISIARASSAFSGWREADGNAAASSLADLAQLGLDRAGSPVASAGVLTPSPDRPARDRGPEWPGCARSIASQLTSRARSAASTAPPPRSPNRRLRTAAR